jgi:tetratricopeptide (TPR) repeat protein
MAKTKTKSHSRNKSSSKSDAALHGTDGRIKSKPAPRPIEELLTQAAELLEQSQPDLALPLADEALRRLEAERSNATTQPSIDEQLQLTAQGKPTLPTTLALAADISLALGDGDTARKRFEDTVRLDPDGALVSADPLLWLAQLSEEGGQESIRFFAKGCEVLRNEIEVLQESIAEYDTEGQHVLEERQAKLADALCGMAEIYMTDLSWEDDAEARCEAYVTEAVAICPERLSAGVLQTLASVRISQEKVDAAREALRRSVNIWKDIPVEVEDTARPDFATRVSLSRLLMEVEAETEAMAVIELLVKEDDESVETWYLGGWCQVLMSQKDGLTETEKQQRQEQAKSWLEMCLGLYQKQDYEDARLKEHAVELKQDLNKILGVEDDDEAWEDDEEEAQDGEDFEFEFKGFDDDTDGDVKMT